LTPIVFDHLAIAEPESVGESVGREWIQSFIVSDAQDAMTASVSGTLDETPESVSVAGSADVMVWVAARPADRSDCSDGGCWLPRVKC
jgi:hypothetical protein